MNTLFKFLVCLLICLGATQTVFAGTPDNPGGKSGSFMKIGAGLMIGGGIVAALGVANAFQDGGSAAFYSGASTFAVGTGMLIWGLSNRSHSLRDSLEAAQSRSFIVGVSPLRKGAAAGAILRW